MSLDMFGSYSQDKNLMPKAQKKLAGIGYGILVPRGRTPFGQHQESLLLEFMDFLPLCAWLRANLANLIG